MGGSRPVAAARGGYLFSAVVLVNDVEATRAALNAAYAHLGLELQPETVECVADSFPGVTTQEVCDELVASLRTVLPMTPAIVPLVVGSRVRRSAQPRDRGPR